MTYDAKNDRFTISLEDLRVAAGQFHYALRNVRLAAGLPLDKYKEPDGPFSAADHAQRGIINAAKHLGIDLGAEWGHDLDLRE